MNRAGVARESPPADEPAAFTARWPAYAIAGFVGLFCMVVAVVWVIDHVVRGNPYDDAAWIVLGATWLRVVTIAIALASVARWGQRLPASLVATGLWGCAAAQLVYPVAETLAKAAILLGVLEMPLYGISNMTAVGWFNFGAAWLAFGVPGLLFILAARSLKNRRPYPWYWPASGLISGIAALFGIGWFIT